MSSALDNMESYPRLDLSGEWTVSLDPNDEGVSKGWNTGIPQQYQAMFPGSLAENQIGDSVTLETPFTGRILDRSFFSDPRYEPYRQPGNIKFPCWLTPLYFYKGPAWYQKSVTIPPEWQGQVIHLGIERAHFVSQLWVDGISFGIQDSLGVPHRYTLGNLLPGEHILILRMDNRLVIDVGEDAHSMSDQSQGSWNGLVGELILTASPVVWIEDIQVYPAADRKAVRVSVELCQLGEAGRNVTGEISLIERQTRMVVGNISDLSWPLDQKTHRFDSELLLKEAALPWDEFDPALYEARVEIRLPDGSGMADNRQFGFRQFEARGRRLYVNDRHAYMRGTLECAVFPLTGYPPTDRPSWDRIMTIIRNHGLNHMRFHSWCPPLAAFEAADEAGIYFSVECSAWAYCGENAEFDDWLYREADRMLRAYGNHPSFCMMLYGNEPYGDNAAPFLGQWVNFCKERDSRRLYSAGTAWPMIRENEFNVWMNPRIQLWDQNLDSRINALPPETETEYISIISEYPQPVISHEIGQWCVYPNFDEIPKYTGVLRAYNFEIFRDFLDKSGQGEFAKQFLDASGKLQVLCYKEEIESALRTQDMGGYQLLDLHDFPGQGSALVGILDAFWDEKGYISPADWKRFCKEVVLLAAMPRRVYRSGDSFECRVLLSHFGREPIAVVTVHWTLSDYSGVIYEGDLEWNGGPSGELYEIGRVTQSLREIAAARKLTLELSMPGLGISNDWDIFVYPDVINLNPPDGVLVTRELDGAAITHLEKGGRTILFPRDEAVLGDARGQVPAGFSSIFWNTAWTTGQQPHTLGILCDPAHPALADFPTDYHSNWQWWYPIKRGRSMILNSLPEAINPIVRVIDDWFTARRLGLVFECRYGGGSLLVCSVDCMETLEDDPVSTQLYYSLLKYAGSDAFAPKVAVSREELGGVLADAIL